MPRIRQSDVEEVKARVNIGDVIGEYVTLKSAGIGSLKGLCPFHDERSPSFHVRPQAGFYHCFGCQESGDVYSFVMKMDHSSFSETVERLAGRIGFPLQYEDGDGRAPETGGRARLLAANDAAEEYFREQLATPGADVGRRFLGERGFDRAAADRFGVGFAPDGWDGLTTALKRRGFSEEELTTAGLVSSNNRGGVYDRFRGRLVWPIRDVTGQTVGFGARRLLEEDKGPKYLNTPETPVYHKSQVLYGLDLAKRDISRGHRVVVVEGYTDVMACHLAGVTTAVATCGTSFGVDHIKVLRRVLGDDSGVGEVVFTFDPDAAGQKAAMRAFQEEHRFAAQTFVAVAPEGLDPCDLRLNRGDDAVRRLIDDKKPMFEFVIRQLLDRYDLETVEGRIAALRAAAPVVAEIRDPALRPGYSRELARMLGLDMAEVNSAVRSAGSRPRSSGPEGRDQQGGRGGGESSAAEAPLGARIADLPVDVVTRIEREALMAMLQLPQAMGPELLARAAHAAVTNETLRVVRDAVVANLERAEDRDWVEHVADDVPGPFASLVRQLAVAPIPAADEEGLARYSRDVAISLIERDLLREIAELRGALQRASADPVMARAVQVRLVELEREKRALRTE
ncbi:MULTISPECIES: DNA primase [unclassified Rathayibacter]|uniref:DNA primase n=1 Tax=unclassified Rathayibacter TaxID=2609250 RepID=UPI000CE796A8|nr:MULTISPECIES: DNA primase [unclassified Rathayibacter]PPF10113.1 DNA primase [Rathayibacter sp. AY1A5]PPG58756.1 DNA primase [Rathayibacter sp. AY1C5]PPH41434.1 DNA primase [Rathayibacter sp. AY1E4]PPH45575.1 DNA primase [Rathayibacter sp. AY1C9]PPH97307.1 DNA primase [Rathayibacter sp. AY1D1]